ncbi:hypothetical protein OBK04_13280 [Empedobacter falsenii]
MNIIKQSNTKELFKKFIQNMKVEEISEWLESIFLTIFLPYDEADKFIEKGDSIVKNKGETSLHIYRNHKLINSLK